MFTSFGFKRYIAGLISIVLELASNVPQLQAIIPALTYIGGFFGVTGVTHGFVASTLGAHTIATIAAALIALQTIAINVPQLQPYVPLIRTLSALFGALNIGLKFNTRLAINAPKS